MGRASALATMLMVAALPTIVAQPVMTEFVTASGSGSGWAWHELDASASDWQIEIEAPGRAMQVVAADIYDSERRSVGGAAIVRFDGEPIVLWRAEDGRTEMMPLRWGGGSLLFVHTSWCPVDGTSTRMTLGITPTETGALPRDARPAMRA